ncbi:MAG: hypothetical protein V4710_02985 [Verrucomicrobiota bacterium]
MNIQQLEATLAGGFHDALLHSYSVDLIRRMAVFRLELCVGDPESPEESIRELRQKAELKLMGLEYLSVDAPDPNYGREAPWQIDLCDADPQFIARFPPPENGFAARFYSSDTNAFIHFAALSAEIAYDAQAQ